MIEQQFHYYEKLHKNDLLLGDFQLQPTFLNSTRELQKRILKDQKAHKKSYIRKEKTRGFNNCYL